MVRLFLAFLWYLQPLYPVGLWVHDNSQQVVR